jgi:hypothetical protein
MGHDWIFDVLKDLRTYALSNDLPALAAKAEDALKRRVKGLAAQNRETSIATRWSGHGRRAPVWSARCR